MYGEATSQGKFNDSYRNKPEREEGKVYSTHAAAAAVPGVVAGYPKPQILLLHRLFCVPHRF